MKVLTVQQPFASLIASGLKEYEFRTWRTAYRGEILIHAAKKTDRGAMARLADLCPEYPTGCIMARATLTDCVRVDDAFRDVLRQMHPTVYAGITESPAWEGYGFRLEDIRPVGPVAAKGMLGLWEYDGEILLPEGAETKGDDHGTKA